MRRNKHKTPRITIVRCQAKGMEDTARMQNLCKFLPPALDNPKEKEKLRDQEKRLN